MEEEIILKNQNLIYYAANFFKNYPYKEDLYHAGRLGMIKAYKKYKSDMNCKFTSYAFFYIVGEMKKLISTDRGIKVGREISKLNLKIEKAYVLLSQKLMKEPSIEEISRFLEIPEYYVSEAILSTNKIKSISEPINNEGKDITLEDVIGTSDNIDELLMLRESLSSLTEEEKEIVNNRYFKDYTQSETSKLIGISQVQVSRKEQKILEKLKQKMVA